MCLALVQTFPKKNCTLTNKAVGTKWRALSKPPQRRQGPDLRLLWLLVGTPSAIRPELAFIRASIACPIRMSLYIFLLYYIYHLCFTCIDFYYLSAWGGCWFVVHIRRFIYNFLNVCPFDCTAVAGSGKSGPVNQVNHTSWVAVVTPTDRPKSVRNRCVIELFCSVVCVVTLPFWHLFWCMGFCHSTGSDLFLFLCYQILTLFLRHERKRTISDTVLWQKPLHQHPYPKSNVTTQTPSKSSIASRSRTDLGPSVEVTSSTRLVWLNRFTRAQPSN